MTAKTLAAAAALILGAATASHAGDPRLASNTAPDAQHGSTTSTTTASPDTTQALNALLTEWDQAGFTPPSKPAQYRVYGRNGYVTTGSGYGVMVSSIRAAITAVHAGHDDEALANIDRAKSMLAKATSTGSRVADR